jgi:hypothetical protein
MSIHEDACMPPIATPIDTPVATPISTPLASSSRSPKVVCSGDMGWKVLDFLLEKVTLGRKGEGGFWEEAWTSIERRFNEELKLNLGRDNFKNKLKMWKSVYRIMSCKI